MINMYHPQLGDIVKVDDETNRDLNYVVIKIINKEDHSSVTYNRVYWLCDVTHFEDNLSHMIKDLQPHIRKVIATGVYFPKFIKVEDVAPYEIKEVEAIELRQKVAKTVTIYE